jgi:3-hydroxyacyl-CoA dehydrogenase/enoyl-CoA hydratase/3-hydroxybutyryl-CoA epimerase
MTENQPIEWQQDSDGVVVLTIDDPTRRVNLMTPQFVEALDQALTRLDHERATVSGVIVASGKSSFFAGEDLHALRRDSTPTTADLASSIGRSSDVLRRLETIGLPVVCVLSGSALGSGLSLALAAHHRIAVSDPRLQLGTPDVSLGLLPCGGGIVRTVRMLGVQRALTELLLKGQRHDVRAAAELGLVDATVDSLGDLLPAAKQWIVSSPEPSQPWDRSGYQLPGGAPEDRRAPLAATLATLPAMLSKDMKGASYPAPHSILAAAVEGAHVDFENARRIESRYYVGLATSHVAANMINTFLHDMPTVSGARGRSSDRTPWTATKAVVLGAGMMGAAIAYECARAGIDVVVKDVTLEAAERGRSYATKLVGKQVAAGRRSEEDAAALIGRITPTIEASDALGADLLVEAVFEDPELKAAVLAEVEPFLAPGALIGSNTSTLPISGLAHTVSDPENFIGLHFFSPVDRMPLLEIIKGEKTSPDTLSRALDLAQQISKTPIVVNDSRGFFTSRVIATLLNEALAILGEGVPAPSIEQASMQAGYPAPVLQLIDELNLELLRRVRDTGRQAAQDESRTWQTHPAEPVLEAMLEDHQRAGRLAGAGFYDYDQAGKRTGLWSGLATHFGGHNKDMPFDDVRERLLFAEAVEAVRCLDDGVIESVADGNVGSLLGIGYPAWTGGVLQYVDGYAGGTAGFVARAQQLADRYGDRFRAPSLLTELAAHGRTLSTRETCSD